MSGPRHTIGWPSGTKNWIEITFTPWRSSGMILFSGLDLGWPSTPSIIGMLGPVMSASIRPTDAPARASATARLTLTVLLPTPPLPDATAMTFLTPGSSCSAARGLARRTVAPQAIARPATPTGSSARRTSDSIWSLSGQAGVVSSIVNATSAPSITRSRIMLRVTRSPPSSGSWTVRRASRTVASEIAVIGVQVRSSTAPGMRGGPLALSYRWSGANGRRRPGAAPHPHRSTRP